LWIKLQLKQKFLILQIWLCTAAFLAMAAGQAPAQDQLLGQALIAALRQGGYNIYFRHAATDWSRHDQVETAGDWKSCDPARMRQLSAEGREVARRIGVAIRRLKIPIGQVLSSEYCRARETAQHMELGPVTATREIMNTRAAEFVGGLDAVTERVRRALATPPKAGTNTVLVAHGNLMRAASGAYTGEGGAAVFAPQKEGGFRLVAQLMPEDWERLADLVP
jgi:phosphohistidine phosphatase SixA